MRLKAKASAIDCHTETVRARDREEDSGRNVNACMPTTHRTCGGLLAARNATNSLSAAW